MKLEAVLEDFKKITKDHSLTVEADTRNCKVLHFSSGRGTGWYRVVAWPSRLCVSGDFGTYVFKGNADMMAFFRGEDVNPGYWGQRLAAEDRMQGYKSFSMEVFKGCLRDQFNDWGFSSEEGKSNAWDGINEEVLCFTDGEEDAAYNEANNYVSQEGHEFEDLWDYDYKEFTYRYTWCCLAIAQGIKMYDEFKLNEQKMRNKS